MNDVHQSTDQGVEFAMRQAERCRNYGPERVENENCIVILADEVERLRAFLAERDERLLTIYEALTGQHRSTWPPAVEGSGT